MQMIIFEANKIDNSKPTYKATNRGATLVGFLSIEWVQTAWNF